ncbi:hypothetical protein BDW67DRAFT_171585 [Aspergillus spinulosporus]
MSLGFCHCYSLSPLPCDRCIFLASENNRARVNPLQDRSPLFTQAARYSSTESTTTHIHPTLWNQVIIDGSVAGPTYYQTACTSTCSCTALLPSNGDSTYVQGYAVDHKSSMADALDNSSRVCEWNGCDEKTRFESSKALATHVNDQHLSRRVSGSDSSNCEWRGCRRYDDCFRRNGDRRRHVSTKHVNPGFYKCPVAGCKKTCNRSDNLAKHVLTHDRLKK